MKKSELKKIAEIAMIAALVGVAVEYFIRPAATNAAKSVT